MQRNPFSGAIVGGVSAVLVVIGSVLPWLSVSSPLGSIGFSGTDGHLIGSSVNRTVTLILGLVAGACLGLAARASNRAAAGVGLLLAGATAGITVYDLADLTDKIDKTHAAGFGSVSIGYGLWITTLAAFALVIGSLMTLSARPFDVRPVTRPVSGGPDPRDDTTEAQEYWARDPFGRHELRWWDGKRYTDKVMDDGVAGTDAPGRRDEPSRASR